MGLLVVMLIALAVAVAVVLAWPGVSAEAQGQPGETGETGSEPGSDGPWYIQSHYPTVTEELERLRARVGQLEAALTDGREHRIAAGVERLVELLHEDAALRHASAQYQHNALITALDRLTVAVNRRTVPGDMNGDGLVNTEDINLFNAALTRKP